MSRDAGSRRNHRAIADHQGQTALAIDHINADPNEDISANGYIAGNMHTRRQRCEVSDGNLVTHRASHIDMNVLTKGYVTSHHAARTYQAA